MHADFLAIRAQQRSLLLLQSDPSTRVVHAIDGREVRRPSATAYDWLVATESRVHVVIPCSIRCR